MSPHTNTHTSPAHIAPPPPPPFQQTPFGLTHPPSAASIAPVNAQSSVHPAPFNGPIPTYHHERPRLIPPIDFVEPSSSLKPKPTLTELRYIAAMSAFRSIGDELISAIADRLEIFKDKLHHLSCENIERIKQAAERAKDAGFWSLLKKIAACFLSALSIVIGGALVSTGGGALLGGTMIASGLLSLTNFTFSEAGVWDWLAKKLSSEDDARRQQIATLVPAIVGVACGIVGICGGVGASFTSGIQLLDKAVFIAQASLSTLQAGTTIGEGYAEYRLLNAKADLSATSAHLTVNRSHADLLADTLGNTMERLSHLNQLSSYFVRLAIRSNQIAVKEIHS